ncbi:MAG: STAS domain-containing protein [Anaerolineae bacterium]|jgi:anti-sigma B factor antagonist|nr:STAS domain-containing protein [Anaerolineae bacterium]
MNIQATNAGQITVLQASGRIDSMNAQQLADTFNAQISAGQTQLVLDLAGVDYMSSAGLRELVNALKKLKKVAGDLRLAQPSKRVREVMEMAGLDTIFLIFETSAEAIDSF